MKPKKRSKTKKSKKLQKIKQKAIKKEVKVPKKGKKKEKGKPKRKKYWLKGFFYGWTFFIFSFFALLYVSDEALFTLLYPGWLVTSFVAGKDFANAPIIGSIIISVIFIALFFYSLLGLGIGLVISKVKYGTFFEPEFVKKVKALIVKLRTKLNNFSKSKKKNKAKSANKKKKRAKK